MRANQKLLLLFTLLIFFSLVPIQHNGVNAEYGTSIIYFSDANGNPIDSINVGDNFYITLLENDRYEDVSVTAEVGVIVPGVGEIGFDILLYEVSPGNNIYRSESITTSGPGGGGEIEVEPGDLLKASYQDPNDPNDRTYEIIPVKGGSTPPTEPFFDIIRLNLPSDVKVGQPVIFSATVMNKGATGTRLVTVAVDNVVFDQSNITLNSGETVDLFSQPYTFQSPGTYTVTFNTQDDVMSGTVAVQQQPQTQIVRFQGTILDDRSFPFDSAAYIVRVEQVIEGSISGEVSIYYLLGAPCPPGHIDPDLKIGERVEVYGEYYPESGEVWVCSSEYYMKRIEPPQQKQERQLCIAAYDAQGHQIEVNITLELSFGDSQDIRTRSDGEWCGQYAEGSEIRLIAPEVVDISHAHRNLPPNHRETFDHWTILSRITNQRREYRSPGATVRLDQDTLATAHFVEMNQPPIADFNWSQSSENVQEIQFQDGSKDPDGDIIKWHWDFGDGTVSNDRNPQHIFAAAGVYEVCLTVTDNDGLQDTICKNVEVEESLEATISEVQFNRVPAITSQFGALLASKPSEYTATISDLGVYLAIRVINPSTHTFKGLVVLKKIIDPDGRERTPLFMRKEQPIMLNPGEEEIAIFSIVLPRKYWLWGFPKAGIWKLVVTLEAKAGLFGYRIVDTKELSLEVISNSNRTVLGPKSLGNVLYFQQSLTNSQEAYKNTFEILKLIVSALCLVTGKCDDTISSSVVDYLQARSEIAQALLNTAQVNISMGSKINDEQEVIIKWRNRVLLTGSYNVSVSYDRAVITVVFPSTYKLGSEFSPTPDFNFVKDGQRYLVWILDYVDKLLASSTSGQIKFTLQTPIPTGKINATVSLMLGPLQGEPLSKRVILKGKIGTTPKLSSLPIIYNYEKWINNPGEVYWYTIGADSDSLEIYGLEISLERGWNAIYISTTEGIPQAVFPLVCGHTVILYLDENGKLRNFDGAVLQPDTAFLVSVSDPCTLSLRGQFLSKSSLHLKKGWNLIGTPVQLPMNLIYRSCSNPIVLTIENDGINGGKLVQINDPETYLRVSQGYLIRVGEDCELDLTTLQMSTLQAHKLASNHALQKRSTVPYLITLEQLEAGSILSTNPSPLEFDLGYVSRGTIITQTFIIFNGQDLFPESNALRWQASADQPWVSLNPSHGIITQPGEENGTIVTIQVNTTGLNDGVYQAKIVVESDARVQPSSIQGVIRFTIISRNLRVDRISIAPISISEGDRMVLTVFGEGIRETKLQIWDLSGQLIINETSDGNSLDFRLRNRYGRPLANGVYIYRVTAKGLEGQIYRSEFRKLIVMK